MSDWLIGRVFASEDETVIALPLALLIAILAGTTFAYFLPWLISKCPVTIKFFENQLMKAQGNVVSTYKFKDMEQYGISTRDGFWVLLLRSNSGRKVAVGVPRNITPEAVAAFLSKTGLKRGSDLVLINKPAPGMS